MAGTDLQPLPASHGINRWLSSRLGTLVRTRTDLAHQSVHSPTRLRTTEFTVAGYDHRRGFKPLTIPMRVSCWWAVSISASTEWLRLRDIDSPTRLETNDTPVKVVFPYNVSPHASWYLFKVGPLFFTSKPCFTITCF